MAFKKIKKVLGMDEKDTDTDDYTDEFTNELADDQGQKMILVEPRAYSESNQIADYLKKKNAVVVNLKRVTPDQAKRIVDFLSGTLYAIGGEIQKLGGGIFLCTPRNIPVEGNISDETGKASKKSEDDDFDF